MVEQLADQQLALRVTQLEQQLFETTETLRRTTEELEAARAINRELMQRVNRQYELVDNHGDRRGQHQQ